MSSSILTRISLAAGALYGYTPDNRKSFNDIVKFTAIVTPLEILRMIGSMEPSQSNKAANALILAPLVIGCTVCIGNQVGKFARNALKEDT